MDYPNDDRIEFLGAPGSPYSLKMLAYLRFRRLPYSYIYGTHDQQKANGYPVPKPEFFPTFYLPDETGERQAVTDSTPLIRRFENEYNGRSALPDDPGLRFLVDLVEDFADEWLTKIMFHFRWAIPENAEFVSHPLIFWSANNADENFANQMAAFFSKRQIDRLSYVGSNDVTAGTIEASYERVLRILDPLIQARGFLFGTRPSAADFAVYGQLSQATRVEPTSTAICCQIAPRVLAWVDLMADQGSNAAADDGWISQEDADTSLRPLFEEIGRTLAPLYVANAAAREAGNPKVECEIDGKPWVQNTFPYQVKCLAALRGTYTGLSAEDQAKVMDVLAGTGCEVLCDANA